MPKSIDSLLSFTTGEVSPKIDARVDQEKYRSAMRQCLNLIPYKTGGVTRRPGTQYMGTAKFTVKDAGITCVALYKFQFSPSESFLLEFGHRYVRFYANGKQATIGAAANWVSGTNYAPGAYARSGGQNYYTAGGVTSATAPPADPVNWVQQSILEQPTPYCAIYYPSGYTPPAWLGPGHNYTVGDYVTAPGPANAYRCQVTYVSTASFTTDLTNGYWLPASAYIDPTGTVFAPLTPWMTDVFFLAPCEINDVIYYAHPQYPPFSLTRYSDVNWKMTQVNFLTPPVLDENVTNIMVTPSALRGAITLTATAPAWTSAYYYAIGNAVSSGGLLYLCTVPNVSGATFAADNLLGYWQQTSVFQPQQIGGTWKLGAIRNSAYIEYPGTAAGGFTAGISSLIQCLGKWEVHTYGVWDADIQVQRSLDGGNTWDTVRTVTGRSDRNVDITGTASQLGIYRLNILNTHALVNAGATNPRVVFECVNAFLYGLVKITAYTSAYVAMGTVVTELSDPNAMGTQWSAAGGYVVGNIVSYLFVNYTCTVNVGPTATPPSQDTGHWGYTTPAGTIYWSEGAWSNYRGFPSAVTTFQQRVIYAGSGFEPQRIWGSVTNDIENFERGDQTLATDSFAFDLNAPGRGPIAWTIAQTDLFVGFAGGEWVVNSGLNTTAQSGSSTITASNVNAVEHSTWGSSLGSRPYVVGDAVMYTQRQATSLRQMTFSIYTGKYMSQDMTALSDHLFASGIAQMTYQTRWRKQSHVWAITQAGTLCGMTYEIDQDVYGWHRHRTGFNQTTNVGVAIADDTGFESVAVIDGDQLADDEIWVVANRLLNGVQTRFIERINPNNWEETFTVAPAQPYANLPDAYYVDNGWTIPTQAGASVAGLTNLVNRWVVGLANGNAFGPIQVDGAGNATIPSSVLPLTGTYKLQIGLPITYAAQSMRIDVDPRAGITQGLVKQISDVYVRVWNSLGGAISNGTANYAFWVSGTAYLAGTYVLSPLTSQSFYALNSVTSATDPANDPTNWAWVPPASYQTPVPISYFPPGTNPVAPPLMVSTPTDIRVAPQLMPVPGHDPVFIVQGGDALPLTLLAFIVKYEITADP